MYSRTVMAAAARKFDLSLQSMYFAEQKRLVFMSKIHIEDRKNGDTKLTAPQNRYI